MEEEGTGPRSRRTLNRLQLALLAIGVGIVAGFGAVVFRGLIAVFHNLFFLARLSYTYDANAHTTASPWGPWIILGPVLGAAGVAFLVKNFAPEAKGHGVPEVMDAIYYNKGVIRPIVAVIKSVASALSIGSGGSVGREGPIIQIGSSFGSTVGQWLRLPVWQRITMIAAGTGGGIAATFNTPIGGILFAVEIMMHEVSARTLVPVTISTVTATYIGRLFFGAHPSFVIPAFERPYFHVSEPLSLVAYIVLGVIMGVISAAFIRSIYGFEDFFTKRIPGGYYVQHMLGMALVGVIMYALQLGYGHYYIEGVGYATIQDVLTGFKGPVYLLLLLCALKLFVTSLTLGSGASGGIFSPSLFLGATFGGAFGIALEHVIPTARIGGPACAVAGMAGVVGGSTGAALAAVVMIFEMTRDYTVIIPMTVTVATAYGLRRVLCRDSIYTLKLVRRGHTMPEALQANFHQMRRVSSVMDRDFRTFRSSEAVGSALDSFAEGTESSLCLIRDGERVVGLATREAIQQIAKQSKSTPLGEIAETAYLRVPATATLLDVINAMKLEPAGYALVVDSGQGGAPDVVLGVVTRDHLLESIVETAEFFSEG